MLRPEHLEDQVIRRSIREVAVGEYLFRQGETGNTMFIIIQGTILLFHRSATSERLIGSLEAGEAVGEKAILRPGYRRSITAQAKTPTVVLEIDGQNLRVIQTKIPEFTTRILLMLSERLEKANEFISILQSTNAVERLVQYLLYFRGHHAKKVAGQFELPISIDDTANAVNLPRDVVDAFINELVGKKILVQRKDGYVLQDENALLSHLTDLKAKLVA